MQTLRFEPEPSNTYDANALPIFLHLTDLSRTEQQKWRTKPVQGSVLLHHAWSIYPPLTRLPTKLSTTFSMHSDAKQTSGYPKFNRLKWQYHSEKWLLGYVPKSLSKHLQPLLSAMQTADLTLVEIASNNRAYQAQLELQLPLLFGLKFLVTQFLLKKRANDWHLRKILLLSGKIRDYH